MKYVLPILAYVIVTWVVAPGLVQAGSGFYVSGDIGANFASGMEFEGDSNDVASHCDALINPRLTGCRQPGHPDKPEGDFRYTNTFIPDWAVDFDRGQGILAGAAVGYSFANQNPNGPLGGFRVELEYFYRQSKYDQKSKPRGLSGATQDKIERNEFEDGPFERLGSITSHNLFGNVYYDFSNASRFTPYVGIGGGIGMTEADYSANWTRTLNKEALRQGVIDDGRPDLADNDTYIDGLAGSSSVAQETLSDTLWGFQVLFGVDYAITDAMSLGLKGRWVRFNSFKDGYVWDPLRSHIPYVGGTVDNPINPVSANISSDDIEFFGISVNMKYHF